MSAACEIPEQLFSLQTRACIRAEVPAARRGPRVCSGEVVSQHLNEKSPECHQNTISTLKVTHKRVFKTRCKSSTTAGFSWWGLTYTELLHFHVNVKSFLISLHSFRCLSLIPKTYHPRVLTHQPSVWGQSVSVSGSSCCFVFFGRNHSRFGCSAKRISAEKQKKKAKVHRTCHCSNYVSPILARFPLISPLRPTLSKQQFLSPPSK